MLLKTIAFLVCSTVCLIYGFLFLKLRKQFAKQTKKPSSKKLIKKLINERGFFAIMAHYLIFSAAAIFLASLIETLIVSQFVPSKPGHTQKWKYYLILAPFLPTMFCFRTELERSIHEFVVNALIRKFGNFKHVALAALLLEYSLAGLLLFLVIALIRAF